MPVRNSLTAPARGIAVKNALIGCVGTLASLSAITATISLAFSQPFIASLWAAMQALLVLAFLAFVVGWFHGQTVAGFILLDCGPFPMHRQALGLVIVTQFIGVGFLGGAMNLFGIWAPMLGILCPAFYLIILTGRLQLRENGIWLYVCLLRWDRISSYHWADDSTLVWKRKNFLGLFQGVLNIPREHRQAFADMLAKRCSAPPST